MRDDFAVFILTHGRADNVITWRTLDKCGYTGRRYVVIDDEDEQEEEYNKRFKGAVLKFSKSEIGQYTDTLDNGGDMRAVLFARNACFRLAEDLGLKYFLELDDDFTSFMVRYEEDGKLKGYEFKNIDDMFSEMVEFLETSGAYSVCFSQGGDFIGGVGNGRFRQGILRKAMNSFFCSVERPFKFMGRMNDDVNTYTLLGSRGKLFMTVCRAMLTQVQTQAGDGGMTDFYKESGTYLKSFYSVMVMPSAVKVTLMGAKHKRIHHNISWDNCVPQILSEKWRKTCRR